MTKIYAELCISNKSKKLLDELSKLTKKNYCQEISLIIGDKKKNSEVAEFSKWVYESEIIETPYVEDVSNILCDTFESSISELVEFIKTNNCKAIIWFIISLGEEGVGIKINKKLLNFAQLLNCEICFDGL